MTINSGDSKDVIQKWFQERKFTLPVGMAGDEDSPDYGVVEKFGVQAYPTNYVLDGEGRVVWRDVGFSEEAIRAALEKLGVK